MGAYTCGMSDLVLTAAADSHRRSLIADAHDAGMMAVAELTHAQVSFSFSFEGQKRSGEAL